MRTEFAIKLFSHLPGIFALTGIVAFLVLALYIAIRYI